MEHLYQLVVYTAESATGFAVKIRRKGKTSNDGYCGKEHEQASRTDPPRFERMKMFLDNRVTVSLLYCSNRDPSQVYSP